jgi:hypothetical protein
MTVDEATYAFDKARTIQRERHCAVQALLDGETFRLLPDRGVCPWWRCLEVTTMAAWGYRPEEVPA